VLVVHNRYREPGGEDRVVELESALLRSHGHEVVDYAVDNHAVDESRKLALAARTIWNPDTYAGVRRLIEQERIDILHVHNTLPLVSPAVYYAAHAEGVPVIQTLHNYRLLCPGAVCFRNDQPCTECVGAATAWRAVRHGCYRGSRGATGTVAAMLLVHRVARTWRDKVDTYIAPTEFARGLFVSGGIPAGRIVVKPHFVDPDPGPGPGGGGYALFVGRLSPEKGVRTLLAAWSRLGEHIPLTIVGDGPLAGEVAEAAARMRGVRFLGRQPRAEVHRLMAHAAFVVFPSLVYETFGQVVAEAFAAGAPVIATRGGAAEELVEHQRTGLLIAPGNADDLAAQAERLMSHPADRASMRVAARATYEARFTAAANVRLLTGIYTDAMARAAARRTAQAAATAAHVVHWGARS
jgi:glycosyltransferase involved in cell wall biosynthesis